jgi:uncharacterized damage-inducible protein DinB
MNYSEYLGNRLREILISGKWVVGTNFKEQIEDVTWQEAIQKVDNFNTIADLTFHIHYYIAGVMQVFKGGELTIRDKYSFDAPEIKNEEDWNARKQLYAKDSESIIQMVENMDNETLLGVFVKEEYGTFFRSVDVIVEHTYYHLGQIILLKKKIRS